MPVAVDPWSAGIMGASSVATAALDDKTNQTLNNSFSSKYDNSGFVVNIGSGSATGATSSPLGISQKNLMLIGLAVAFYFMRKK
jgi:hypothetical protein